MIIDFPEWEAFQKSDSVVFFFFFIPLPTTGSCVAGDS